MTKTNTTTGTTTIRVTKKQKYEALITLLQTGESVTFSKDDLTYTFFPPF